MAALKRLEKSFKKAVVTASQSLFMTGRKELAALDGNAMQRILIIRPEKLGDTVISLPLVDELKRQFPQLKISLLTSPTSLPIVKDDPRFSSLFLYRKRPLSDMKELMALRTERFDCVIDLIFEDSVTALYLSQLCAQGAPRIGVRKSQYAKFYDFCFGCNEPVSEHAIDAILKSLAAFGTKAGDSSGYAPPFVNLEAQEMSDRVIQNFKSENKTSTVIGYNLSAGKKNRLWPRQKIESLLKQVLEDDSDCCVILLCMPDERQNANSLAGKIGKRVRVIPEGWNIMQASALIGKLDLLFTPDTSLVHIARSFRVPVVGLYPEVLRNFVLWRPYGQQGGAVTSTGDSIYDITVEQVFEAYYELKEPNGRMVR